jgi:3-hydroxyisobutyrate dehydrogenase-like beta-hydroxyacid dehydrogenase
VILTFVGFGELTASWAGALAGRDDLEVRVYARPRPDDPRRCERSRAAGLDLHADLAGALAGADVVLACVPARASAAVAGACTGLLPPGSLYIDPAPAEPAAKRRLAAEMAAAEVDYADAALLGTVVVSGLELPTLAAGPGAARWAQIAAELGMRVTAIAGDAGRATAIKLIRSVYMKGRDALVLEMLVAARRHGVEAEVIGSIGGPGERVPFEALADRVLGALSVHAGRRADELAESAREIETVDLEPLVTRAAEERLRWMAGLDLGELRERREDAAAAVLDAIDASTGGAP